ncbi:hypothetical protein GDO78_014570 [Eleutherodactylus coqui]|uniref:Uncharacterized protein n=1 Tax=Eleutherodactylus coqui TaxID=57060 RepID=A0A8J6EEJ5_ELECQ|nr:hypothetical protein GDO78_014570 [Eleutherodactylus coqui]
MASTDINPRVICPKMEHAVILFPRAGEDRRFRNSFPVVCRGPECCKTNRQLRTCQSRATHKSSSLKTLSNKGQLEQRNL